MSDSLGTTTQGRISTRTRMDKRPQKQPPRPISEYAEQFRLAVSGGRAPWQPHATTLPRAPRKMRSRVRCQRPPNGCRLVAERPNIRHARSIESSTTPRSSCARQGSNAGGFAPPDSNDAELDAITCRARRSTRSSRALLSRPDTADATPRSSEQGTTSSALISRFRQGC